MSIFACGKRKNNPTPEMSFAQLQTGKFVRITSGELRGACFRVYRLAENAIYLISQHNNYYSASSTENNNELALTLPQKQSVYVDDLRRDIVQYTILNAQEQGQVEYLYPISFIDLVDNESYFLGTKQNKFIFTVLAKFNHKNLILVFSHKLGKTVSLSFDQEKNQFTVQGFNIPMFCYKAPAETLNAHLQAQLLEAQSQVSVSHPEYTETRPRVIPRPPPGPAPSPKERKEQKQSDIE